MHVDSKYLDEKDQPGIFEPVIQSLRVKIISKKAGSLVNEFTTN
jgi:hypothetical protein